MTDTINAISRSLNTDVQTLGTVSQNVANLNTPGYRAARSIPEFGAVTGMNRAVDQEDGSLAQTAAPLDLALRGPGFFAVQRDGKTLLMRSGMFHLDANGQLVTIRGDSVLGESGPVTLSTSRVRVDAHGAIWDGAQNVGQLQVIDVADAGALRPAGDGAYAYDGMPTEWTGSIVQGAVEQSNVDAAGETVRLMETTRHAESVQHAISIYDKAMDVGINHLGDN